MPDPRLVFVLSPFQNAFFGELADALVEALAANGVAALIVHEPDQHAVADHDVVVLLPPHEWVTLEGTGFLDDPTVAARTIGLSAEQPHQVFFERNAAIGARLGAVMDFSPLAVNAYRALGVAAHRLPFGYVPSWDRFDGPGATRDVSVLYLGNKRPRRLAALGSAADALERCRAQLVVSDNAEPNRGSGPAFVAGEAKRDLLARTRLVVNIHQSDEPYFEWLRVADAAHCGAAVLTEHSEATDPWVEGRHFLSFRPGGLADALDRAMSDHDRLVDVSGAAYEQLRSVPLVDSVGALVEVARSMLRAPPPDALPTRTRTLPIGRDRTDPEPVTSWAAPRRRVRVPGRRVWRDISPPGTTWRRQPDELWRDAGASIVTAVADGVDADGVTTIEGFWPWQPWRLRYGEHLGRVMLVDAALLDDAMAWAHRHPDVEALRSAPHVAVATFAALHGVTGHHIATPVARLSVTADPTHALPDAMAAAVTAALATAVAAPVAPSSA